MGYFTPVKIKNSPCTARQVLKRGRLHDGLNMTVAFYRLIFDGDELKEKELKHSNKLTRWRAMDAANPEKSKAQHKADYVKFREKKLKYKRDRYADDTAFRDKFIAKAKDYYAATSEARLKQKSTAYYADVDGKFSARSKQRSAAYHADIDGKHLAYRVAKNSAARAATVSRKQASRAAKAANKA